MQRLLVAYATKHGSTKEVADAVAKTLGERGVEVDLRPAGDVSDLSGYSAVVLGMAIYFPRPVAEARRFLSRHGRTLAHMPVAVFALGPINDTPEDFAGVRKQLAGALAKYPAVNPVATEVFGGVMDPAHLKFPFKNAASVTAGRTDIRDWDAIRAWAESLPEALGLSASVG